MNSVTNDQNVLILFFRFYVETIGLLRDTQTVELFYLNARQAVFRVSLWHLACILFIVIWCSPLLQPLFTEPGKIRIV